MGEDGKSILNDLNIMLFALHEAANTMHPTVSLLCLQLVDMFRVGKV